MSNFEPTVLSPWLQIQHSVMGRTRGRRRLRDDEPEIDLLATTFNLPTRQTVQRNEKRGAQRVTISYESESDEDDDEEKEDGDSSDSLSVSDAYLSSEDEDEEEEESEDDQQEPTRPYRGSSRSKHAPLSQPKQPKDQRCLKLNKKAHQPAPKRPTPTPRRTRQPSQQRSRSRHDKRRDSGDVSSLRPAPKISSIPSSATFPPQAIPHMPYGMMPGFIAPQFSQFPMANPIHPPPPPPQVYNQPRFAFIQAPNPTQASQPAIPFGAHHPHSSMGGRQKKASKELTRIQRDLDQKSAALERHPGDFSLEAEVKALQQRLNLTLNEVMGRGRSARTDKSPSEMKSSETKHRSKSVGSKQEDIPEAAHQQDKLPAHQPSRHVCFGCGSIRSRKYHEMHPLAPGKQKFPSLCEGCRDEVHRKDVMDHHCRHVCFGCGIYRSKSFHKKHPAKSGDAILPNYCSRCLMERHAAEEATVVTDASSVMNSVSRLSQPLAMNKPLIPPHSVLELVRQTEMLSTVYASRLRKLSAVMTHSTLTLTLKRRALARTLTPSQEISWGPSALMVLEAVLLILATRLPGFPPRHLTSQLEATGLRNGELRGAARG